MYELRPYQLEAKNAVIREWDVEGHRKTLLVLPTGAGKTIVFASIAEDRVKRGGRVLILAHRDELLKQAADKLEKAVGLTTVLEKAEYSSIGSDIPITVGSVQSMSRIDRLNQFSPYYFRTIIVDEAHHALSESYQTVLNHFPQANVLGVTATPDRGDKRNLGGFFDSEAYDYPLREAVKEKYLCPVTAEMIPLKMDLTHVKTSMGDYSEHSLGDALEPYLEQIADEMVKSCKGRKTLVFLPLIETSQKFCEILKERGMKAAEVHGTSPDRDEILADFESGRYDVLCNAMLLTEGWDCPSVDCIVVLRPTKIRSLYQQMVGRGMRPAPGKENLLLLDFLWMTTKHSLCRPSSLVSKNDEVAAKIDDQILNGMVDLIDAEDQAERDVAAEREAAVKRELAAQRHKKRTKIDPINMKTYSDAGILLDYEETWKWEFDRPTQAQLKALENFGVDPETVRTKGYACALLKYLTDRSKMGLATPRQVEILKQKGFTDAETWSFQKANGYIALIASNHWRLTPSMRREVYGG